MDDEELLVVVVIVVVVVYNVDVMKVMALVWCEGGGTVINDNKGFGCVVFARNSSTSLFQAESFIDDLDGIDEYV